MTSGKLVLLLNQPKHFVHTHKYTYYLGNAEAICTFNFERMICECSRRANSLHIYGHKSVASLNVVGEDPK